MIKPTRRQLTSCDHLNATGAWTSATKLLPSLDATSSRGERAPSLTWSRPHPENTLLQSQSVPPKFLSPTTPLNSLLKLPAFNHECGILICYSSCSWLQHARPNVKLIHRAKNSTASFLLSLPDTYAGYFDEISKYNVHLNFAEKAWAAWYACMQNDVLATGIMSFLMHEIVYFGRSLPWIIADRLPYFNRYRIQNVWLPWLSPEVYLLKLFSRIPQPLPSNGAARVSSFSPTLPSNFHKYGYFILWHNSVAFPPAFLSPSIFTMAYQIAVFFVLEDTWHYWSHRALHTPRLYKMIHKIIHQYSTPFGLAAEYASPIWGWGEGHDARFWHYSLANLVVRAD